MVQKNGKKMEKISHERYLHIITTQQRFHMQVTIAGLQISKDPPDAEDALNLQVQLDQMLAVRLAKPSGVCPIRQSIYDDCFSKAHPSDHKI